MTEHRLPLIWHDILAGHLALPEQFRPPMSEQQLGEFSHMLTLLIRSTSFLFTVRPGDFTLRIVDGEMHIACNDRLGPGDISCIEGLIPADPMFERNEDEEALERTILARCGLKSRRAGR